MALSTTQTYALQLLQRYASFNVKQFHTRRFSPEEYHKIIDGIIKNSRGRLEVRPASNSFEGRPIRLISAGTGSVHVLLWSQMHGDESTATMAIADTLQSLSSLDEKDPALTILSALTLHFLPMLNPDGAARFQRRTAQQIDMNRDALALRTPEARILKQLQQEIKPEFGFNLHDQELSTVGTSRELAAIALLAPAYDSAKSENNVRGKAKQLAATCASIIGMFARNSITRYDDSFEPRAFGDNMQKWGTSTVLIESGHTINDPEKNLIRKLNCIAMLTSLYAIASGEYKESQVQTYESLPFNGKKAYDLIIRNVLIEYSPPLTSLVDLGISYQVDTHTGTTPTLVDLGDLHTFVGLKEIDGRERRLAYSLLTLGKPFEWEKFFALPS